MKATKAFTLLEVLIALSILTLLLTMAVPSIQHLLLENRVATQISVLHTGLYYARGQAVERGEKVIFCKSSNHKTCGGNWRDGQIVITEAGQLLRVFSRLPTQDNLVWNSSGGKDDAVWWLPTGHTNGQRGTFYYCVGGAAGAAYSKSLVLLDTGRLYQSAVDNSSYQHFCTGLD